MILEDRRIRMNAWVSKLIGKPLDKFVNPKLLESIATEEERKDPKSVHFAISRTEPLSYSIKPKNINEVYDHFYEERLIFLNRLQWSSQHHWLIRRNWHWMKRRSCCSSCCIEILTMLLLLMTWRAIISLWVVWHCWETIIMKEDMVLGITMLLCQRLVKEHMSKLLPIKRRSSLINWDWNREYDLIDLWKHFFVAFLCAFLWSPAVLYTCNCDLLPFFIV